MILRYKYEILIFLFALLTRVPSLGYDTFNTDVWKWKVRTYNFSNGIFTGNFDLTNQKYHPGVTLMWLGTAGIKVYNLYYDVTVGGEPAADDLQTVFGLNSAQKFFVILSVSFCLTVLFYALRQMFGLRFAVLSVLLLSLEPFYIALTREFHLEGLMSTYMIASVVLAFYWLNFDKVSKVIFVLSALFAALAVLTKVSAIITIPFIAIAFIVFHYNRKVSITLALKSCILWCALVALFVFVHWPALWVSPLEVFNTLYSGIFDVGVEGGHAQFYFGKFVQDPGFSFYFVAMFLRSSIFLIPGFLGYLLWARKLADPKIKPYVKYLFLFSVVYLIPMLLSSKKLDRYMLPSLIGLGLISSVFYYYLIRNFYRVKLILVAFMLTWGLYLSFLHPDYLSYYSPYGGGLTQGMFIIEPKWVIGAHEIKDFVSSEMNSTNQLPFTKAARFNKIKRNKTLMDNKLVVALPEKYYTQTYPFINQTGAWAVIASLRDDAQYADYFIYPVWEDTSGKVNRHKLEYYDSIYINGVFRDSKAFNVYKRVGE